MSDSFEFYGDDSSAGFRLDYMQMYNWGTFHNHVVTLLLRGRNALITGPNGSGKSTFIDGITTLLYPAHRVRYNQASGGTKVERKIRDYFYGTYNTVFSEDETSVRDVSLRPGGKHISILLARFYNRGTEQTVTLCQVMYARDKSSQIERLYILSRHPLRIEEHFSDIPDKITDLRKFIQNIPGTELHPSFTTYAQAFQRLFSMKSSQPLELFHKTISMKQVDNYTEFIRQLMLEPNDPTEQLETLISHFDNLSNVHDRLVELEKQRRYLDALFIDVEIWEKHSEDLERYKQNEEIIPLFGKFLRLDFASAEQQRLSIELASREQLLSGLQSEQRELQTRLDRITTAISENGGQRLNELKTELADIADRLEGVKRDADTYRKLVRQLALPFPDNEEDFEVNRREISQKSESSESRRDGVLNQIAEAHSDVKRIRDERHEYEQEVESLKTRENNMDIKTLGIRRRLGEELDISVEQLPFVAELLAVRNDEQLWEGAIERHLNSFAKTLLFPADRKDEIEQWINANHLRSLLVAEPVDLDVTPEINVRGIARQSVYNKLDFHTGNPYTPWIQKEILKRFNYTTCADIQKFHYEEYAITPQGLIKRGGRQLRKDDRSRIDDRSRYILGWDTSAKIRTLESLMEELSARIDEHTEHLERFKTDDRNLKDIVNVCQNLLFLDKYERINIKPLSLLYQNRIDEQYALENSSDILKDLEENRASIGQELQSCSTNITDANRSIGGLTDRLNEINGLLEDLASELAELQSHRDEVISAGKTLQREAKEVPAGVNENEIIKHIDKLFAWNRSQKQKAEAKVREIEQKLVGAMSNLGGNLYPADMRDFGNTMDSLEEYRRYHEHLIHDDLPQFKSRFKRMLNQETVQGIVQFRQHLEFVRERMERGIREVNRSMKEINFSEGRYLELIARSNPDITIREFKSELRSCTEDSAGSGKDDVFSEDRFLQVKKLIERFRTEIRWTKKVCDVRNWLVFQISEKRRKDDQEVARYSDSNRKSGGEKEKLAYTILAASLAYQFGLKLGETRSDSFRFVMIDEAFHKASSDSTRYGMELFKLFNLQLLLVTPNKDIPIIEQYVSTVGLTHKNEASHSMLYTTDIETFMEKRAQVADQVSGQDAAQVADQDTS